MIRRLRLPKGLLSKCAAFISVAVAWAAASCATPSAAAPRASCTQPTFAFGERAANGAVEHTFVIQNTGDQPLVITAVRPVCGCTVASWSDAATPPGGEADVTATLALSGRDGPQDKAIDVASNDPQTPHLSLRLTGVVRATVRLNPDTLFFGRILTDAAAERTVAASAEQAGARVTGATSDAACVDASVEPAGAGACTVRVRLRPPLPEGPLRATIRLTTGSDKIAAVEIPVSAFVVGELGVWPAELATPDAAGQAVIRYVTVAPGRTKRFRITGVETPSPDISVAIVPAGDGYRIRLAGIPGGSGMEGKAIRIRTDVERMSEIAVPIHRTSDPGRSGAATRPSGP